MTAREGVFGRGTYAFVVVVAGMAMIVGFVVLVVLGEKWWWFGVKSGTIMV